MLPVWLSLKFKDAGSIASSSFNFLANAGCRCGMLPKHWSSTWWATSCFQDRDLFSVQVQFETGSLEFSLNPNAGFEGSVASGSTLVCHQQWMQGRTLGPVAGESEMVISRFTTHAALGECRTSARVERDS